jgi:hypothetical protein
MREADLMRQASRKIRCSSSRIGRLPGTAQAQFCNWLPDAIDGKIFQNLPRVFLRKKPGANHQKTKPTKENRKDAHAAINHE